LNVYVNILRQVAEYYSLPVLDLYACSGMQPNVPQIRKQFVPDGLHPNNAGHIKLADLISHFILNI
ncbi:MAG TPA: SGNH/GDSL hydrolase family protein, partial [Bacillota bacterium]|nr:SGNH/GDSL hydrolase family protein [Bacillota bacterium]